MSADEPELGATLAAESLRLLAVCAVRAFLANGSYAPVLTWSPSVPSRLIVFLIV